MTDIMRASQKVKTAEALLTSLKRQRDVSDLDTKLISSIRVIQKDQK